MRLQRRVTVDTPIDRVFAYLSDFTTTTEWDPGTVRTTRVSGDGGVGTRYANITRFRGRETELTYVVQELEPGRRIALRGENKTVEATDTLVVRPARTSTGTGTEVTYTADFTFKGVARFVAPLLTPALRRLGDEAEKGLRETLSRL